MMHIESILPLWLVLPLVALAIFVAWILYFRKQPESVLPRPVAVLLGIARLLIILLTGLLIISPMIRTTVERKEKPVFIVAHDNSLSMPAGQDTTEFIRSRSELHQQLIKNLDNRFIVKEIRFGESVSEDNRCDYREGVTDPGELFDYIRRFSQMYDLEGVLLTTDGVSTKGVSFSDAVRNFPYPVYVLGSGDSTRVPDVRIQDVVSNEWVRKSSSFPVRVYFNLGDYSGSGFTIQVLDSKGVIAEQYFKINGQVLPYADFLILAPEFGTVQVTARIIPDVPDRNLDNNSRTVTVRVIEQEAKVLCLYAAPHPDVDAMVQAIRGLRSINLTVSSASDFNNPGKDYDLVILHGLPALKLPMEDLLTSLMATHTPFLFIISRTTDPVLFNRMSNGMIINTKRRTGEAAKGVLNKGFSLFSIPEDFPQYLDTWPPLELAFEVYTPDPGSQILMHQKILSVELPDPLVVFTSRSGTKFGFLCGEGIWRWRLQEYLEQKSHSNFDEWLSRSVQYLMLDEKEDRFRIKVPDEPYSFSAFRINAHLLNNSLETVNEPEVVFRMTDSSGQITEYQMGRTKNYYELILSGFPAGQYRYSAETRLGEESFRREGSLTLLNRPMEQANPVADFPGLRLVAQRTNGRFYHAGQEQDLLASLKALEPSETKSEKEFKWYDLISISSLLGALIVLMGLEWFLRRWYGIR